ncbi:MAG: alpha/beta hydrolase [Desulfobacteraceae bacterium]|nr:alpha/beta hydrolase [Desulfobacteraceae bacterium]
MHLREEAKSARKSAVLVGNVSSALPFRDAPVVVAAYSEKDSKRTIVHYTTLHEPGPYELMVPNGIHNIVAFADKNKNLIYDKGEPAGQILSAEQVSAPVGGVTGNLDIVISEHNSKKIDFPVGSELPPKKYRNFHSTCPGAIAKVEDVLFSDEYGKKGFWTGLEFFREIGGNVYFLEAYDPAKIPILFVHGAAGSPQNWQTFFKSIDRSKYQPWFFYYPSGSSIDSISYLLLWKLQNLWAKYEFRELYITAHSMGGLVVRSFLVNYGHFFPGITNFISISTPWGGEALAELGVKYSPAVIPAWRDMQPGSEFINSIFRKKMPPTVEYYLFFGHKGNRNMLRPNNDKVVTLASQLDHRSQREAKMVYGFNEDHVSILSSKQVISQYNAILADIYQKTKGTDKISGNRLCVDFSFDFPKDLPRPMSSLLLRPAGKKGDEIWLSLNPEDTGREYGPFPSGNYEVSMIAPAFVPEPVSISVSIEEGTVPIVEFSMKPVGILRGYVVKNEQRYIPLGKYRQADTEVQIQSITLRGGGINRTLIPLQEKDVSYSEYSILIPLLEEKLNFAEYYLSATDFVFKGLFFFFGLPAGEYELVINAKGYEQYSEICNVRLGQYQNVMLIELVKETVDPS